MDGSNETDNNIRYSLYSILMLIGIFALYLWFATHNLIFLSFGIGIIALILRRYIMELMN